MKTKTYFFEIWLNWDGKKNQSKTEIVRSFNQKKINLIAFKQKQKLN